MPSQVIPVTLIFVPDHRRLFYPKVAQKASSLLRTVEDAAGWYLSATGPGSVSPPDCGSLSDIALERVYAQLNHHWHSREQGNANPRSFDERWTVSAGSKPHRSPVTRRHGPHERALPSFGRARSICHPGATGGRATRDAGLRSAVTLWACEEAITRFDTGRSRGRPEIL